jgi:vacuolar-type H+-ATPase subunit H
VNYNLFERFVKHVINLVVAELSLEACDSSVLVDVDELVNEYNKKYGRLLNEAEQELVKVISDARAPHAQRMQQKLFDKFKNECVELVDKLIPESNADEREKLDGIKTRLSEMAFNQGTLVKYIANLLGIRDVLMDA